jgi:hypothetical protein
VYATGTVFDQLFDRGSEALRGHATGISSPPVDGAARWGVSVILRPDPTALAAVDGLTSEALDIVGVQHWPTGNTVAAHLTVRSLEAHRAPIGSDDPAIARYAAALRRTASRVPGPVRFALTGVTLTPTCVMCCAEPLDSGADDLTAVLAEELGPDAWHEKDFNRDIWYVSLVHYTGPITPAAALIDWVRRRRRMDIGTVTVDSTELMKWRYDGRQVVPVPLVVAPLATG